MSLEFKEVVEEFDFQGTKCSLSTGKLARRASASVVGRMGETVVLVTVSVGDPMEGANFFPLSVEYIERMYAGGLISSSRFVKRERHPSLGATLAARMIDRAIRSRFPSDYRNEVQVVLTVLSYDPDHDPIIVGFSAVSAALMISEAPFEGPVAGLRVGYDGEKVFVCNKDLDVDENGDSTEMNFVLGTDGEMVTMIDADSEEIPEETVIEAMKFGAEESKAFTAAQESFVKKVEKLRGGIFKAEYESFALPKEILTEVRNGKKEEIEKALKSGDENFKDLLDDVKEALFEEYEGKYSKSQLSDAMEYVTKEIVQGWLLNDQKRMDGRAVDEIRPLGMEIGVLPRAHGSAMFARGLTQTLTVATLGSGRLEQIVEGMEGEGTRRYMHHYNAQDFTVGETGRYRYFPKRREVGHGALAEKALLHVIPDKDVFPYTVRVVSEIMSQNGSSSMAAVCGSTLSLMDAGVPIKKPVAGIAMGVITSDDMKSWTILTDIAGLEDAYGHMDFKVTGTRDGVTAVQMDNKRKGLPVKVFEEAITRAKEARMFILDEIEKVIDQPRVGLSKYAPKIDIVQIPPSKIGELIGPGGKVIKNITETSGAEVDVDDDGRVSISSIDDSCRQKAVEMVEGLFMEPEIGKVYKGKVAKVVEFGAFVDVAPSISGLVHVSEMSNEFVKDPGKIVKEGQEVEVKVIGIDEKGRVKMSMKQVGRSGNDTGKKPSEKQDAGKDHKKKQ